MVLGLGLRFGLIRMARRARLAADELGVGGKPGQAERQQYRQSTKGRHGRAFIIRALPVAWGIVTLALTAAAMLGPLAATRCAPSGLGRTSTCWAVLLATASGSPSPTPRRATWLCARSPATPILEVTSKDPAAEKGQFAYFSVIAPKGDQVAYAWFNDEGFYELRLAAIPLAGAKRGPPRTLVRNPEAGFVQPCAFSPDGSQILTLFFRRDNISQIALVSTEDGSVKTLRSLNWIYPKRMDFSPDGRFIVYDNLSGDGAEERDLWALAVDGSEETRLLGGPSNDLFPLWSPDGGSVLFSSDRGGSPGLWALPVADGAAAGEPRLLRSDLGRFLPLGVTEAGAVVLGRRRGGVDIRVAAVDGSGEPQTLPAPPETDLLGPALSPNGERPGLHRSCALGELRAGAPLSGYPLARRRPGRRDSHPHVPHRARELVAGR